MVQYMCIKLYHKTTYHCSPSSSFTIAQNEILLQLSTAAKKEKNDSWILALSVLSFLSVCTILMRQEYKKDTWMVRPRLNHCGKLNDWIDRKYCVRQTVWSRKIMLCNWSNSGFMVKKKWMTHLYSACHWLDLLFFFVCSITDTDY